VNGDLTEVVGSYGRQRSDGLADVRAQGVPSTQIRYDASGQLDPDLAQVVDLRQLRDSMSRS
jgi:hypothetical protein